MILIVTAVLWKTVIHFWDYDDSNERKGLPVLPEKLEKLTRVRRKQWGKTQVRVAKQDQSNAPSSTFFKGVKEIFAIKQRSKLLPYLCTLRNTTICNNELPLQGYLIDRLVFVLYRKFWPGLSLQIRDRFSICFLIFPKVPLISIWIEMFTGKYYRDWVQVLR